MLRPAQIETREPLISEEPSSADSTKRRRLWLIAIGALVLLVLFLGGTKFFQISTMIKAGKAMVPPPESVTSAKAELADWRPVRAAVGTLVAVRGVTLSAEVTGTVREIAFENGGQVKQGQLLVRLDTSSEQAQLEGALADAELARLTLERARTLRKDVVNTQAELEAAEARAAQTNAAVANLRAIIAKKVIRAPFDGRVGIRQVELGQVVSPGSPIVSLQTVTPIYAEFQLPQQALADVKLGQQVQLKVDVFPGASWEGTVTTINPEVDPGTRNVRMRATVPNPDGRLTPGMFASVEVLSEQQERVLLIPATSILFAPFGDSVYVLETEKSADGTSEKLVAHQRFVRTGERRGDFVAIVSGLKPGETVASNGAFKLRNGMAVQLHNALAPPAQLAPAPVDR
ncbi:MAG TPA: efflux RND transporter periplasmic adaptor subunit [Myxococcaceae bacterium]|nr:efflux RND transporter periplasmic adaptor subunit [Myxococcaceae bacterium]